MGADEEDFRYPALVNRWQRERATVALTKMDGNFYELFDRHLRELVAEYQKEHALNPATPKVLILQDEMSNLQRVRDDLYDLREKKIVTAALIAARGGNPDRSNMTKEEDLLFEEMLRVLRDARRNLLLRGAPAKELPKPAPAGPPVAPEAPAREVVNVAQPASDLAQRTHAPEPAPEAPLVPPPAAAARTPAPAPEAVAMVAEERAPKRMGPARTLVRVLGEVAPFVASDMRQYRVAPEDVVAVPKEIAHVLVGRGLARVVGA